VPNGRPTGLPIERRRELYGWACTALGHGVYDPRHYGRAMPTTRNWPAGWTDYGRAQHRMELLKVLAVIYRIDLDDTQRRLVEARSEEYAVAIAALHADTLADTAVGEAETAPIRMRRSRGVS
jgi:hypothetical protein